MFGGAVGELQMDPKVLLPETVREPLREPLVNRSFECEAQSRRSAGDQ